MSAMPFQNITNNPGGERVFDESVTTVKLKCHDGDENLGTFECDEEPLILSPQLGYGYYPAILGEFLDEGAYEVVRKLGWGRSSSVWLARVHSEPLPRYVAIKVLTVNATAAILQGYSGEHDFLVRVTNTNSQHPGYKHCLTLRNEFLAQSKHGPHICLVTDVFGSNLTKLRVSQRKGVFDLCATKRVVKHTLLALDYLHRECRIVHCDVKPNNILVAEKKQDDLIQSYLTQNPSATYDVRMEPDLSPDPIITVKTQPLPDFDLDPTLSNLEVRLIDYGSAVPADTVHQGEAQPVLLRAPEVILGHPWSTPVDIWSVGCLVFEYLAGTPLFQLRASSSVTFTDTHLQGILEHIGPFPSRFLDACSRRSEYFDKRGSLLRVQKLFPRSIDECLRHYRHLDEAGIAPAAVFIRRCLTIDPDVRPSASELLGDGWLKDV